MADKEKQQPRELLRQLAAFEGDTVSSAVTLAVPITTSTSQSI